MKSWLWYLSSVQTRTHQALKPLYLLGVCDPTDFSLGHFECSLSGLCDSRPRDHPTIRYNMCRDILGEWGFTVPSVMSTGLSDAH